MGDRVLITTLTKRMAENLTEYLSEHDVRVRYLHSDIDTVERRGDHPRPAAGKFDVLVGINLLREGLDMPEVSLVAILDADKEGFLRSTGSLIQTIAARRAQPARQGDPLCRPRHRLDETRDRRDRRRRARQVEYTLEHGITPRSVARPVWTSWKGAQRAGRIQWAVAWPRQVRAVAERPEDYPAWPAKAAARSRRWSSRCTSTPATSSSRRPPGCATRSIASRRPCSHFR